MLSPSGPSPQSYAWMVKVCSFCSSQSSLSLARITPSPVDLSSTTASNGTFCPWILKPQISPESGEKRHRTSQFSRVHHQLLFMRYWKPTTTLITRHTRLKNSQSWFGSQGDRNTEGGWVGGGGVCGGSQKHWWDGWVYGKWRDVRGRELNKGIPSARSKPFDHIASSHAVRNPECRQAFHRNT